MNSPLSEKDEDMSRAMIDKTEKAKEIARAALASFSQKGYAATSVDRIAQTAGVGKGTIYEYYDTKEELFIAAIMEWLGQFEMRLAAHLEGIEDPIRRLRAIAEIHLELYDQIDPATMRLFLQILQQSLMEGGVIFKRRYLVKEMAAGMRRAVMDVLLDGISQGVFRPEIARDAEKLAI
ncbi:MAG: TetR/AcrR family transcriptional regulator, partial [Desulfobacterales bacterium]